MTETITPEAVKAFRTDMIAASDDAGCTLEADEVEFAAALATAYLAMAEELKACRERAQYWHQAALIGTDEIAERAEENERLRKRVEAADRLAQTAWRAPDPSGALHAEVAAYRDTEVQP